MFSLLEKEIWCIYKYSWTLFWIENSYFSFRFVIYLYPPIQKVPQPATLKGVKPVSTLYIFHYSFFFLYLLSCLQVSLVCQCLSVFDAMLLETYCHASFCKSFEEPMFFLYFCIVSSSTSYSFCFELMCMCTYTIQAILRFIQSNPSLSNPEHTYLCIDPWALFVVSRWFNNRWMKNYLCDTYCGNTWEIKTMISINKNNVLW